MQRLELIFDAIPNIMLVANRRKLFKANRAMLSFFGVEDTEEFRAKHKCICELFLEEEGCIQDTIEGVYWLEYLASHSHKSFKAALEREGKRYYFQLSVQDLHYELDEAYLILLNDITEIELQRERLEFALRGSSDGLWDWNLLTNEVYFSPRWKEMLGYKDEELPCALSEWEKRVHPDDLQNALSDINHAIENKVSFYHNIHRLRHKDGHWVWILDRGDTIVDKEGRAVRMLGFHTDISDLKNYEAQMLEKEEIMIAQSRHAAMGEMISMIAHQWRQPISIIAMEANTVLADIELGMLQEDALKETAEDILKQTEELSKTIDDFRNFFRPDKQAESIRIETLLHEACGVIEGSLGYHKIDFISKYDKEIEVFTYSRELMQVLINIIKNAQEALIEQKIEAKKIMLRAYKEGSNLFIAICDNAKGVKEAYKEKIFEPYFTTKKEREGTGLGLYISKIIVQKHLQGKISLKNEKEGACFILELPLVLQIEGTTE